MVTARQLEGMHQSLAEGKEALTRDADRISAIVVELQQVRRQDCVCVCLGGAPGVDCSNRALASPPLWWSFSR